MDIAALITWVVTALGGFTMLGIWIARGGVRQQQSGVSRLPAPVLFGHFTLAAAGLVVWLLYVVTDERALAWTAFGLLVLIALLGFTMFARWIPVYRSHGAGAAGSPAGSPAAERAVPAERHFPVAVVVGHGLFAVVTLVLVLVAAIGGGGG